MEMDIPRANLKSKQRGAAIKKVLTLPPPHDNNDGAIQYLIERRGIHPAIVRYCIENSLVYEGVTTDRKGRKHRNVVFVGYDKKNVARYGFMRSMGYTRFARDADGSDKSYCFHIEPARSSRILLKTEADIDLLSVASLACYKFGNNWRNYHYLSAGGAARVSMERYLQEHPEIDTIHFCNDNDERGRELTARQIQIYGERGYNVVDKTPPSVGGEKTDCNDYLLSLIQKQKSNKGNKQRRRANEGPAFLR
ncbi:DUF3991 and toprim domain-containing protein [Oscillospiraceae bacterium OttesenSCG-928-F05]|nr:DUF3991 and toprim domain-containing protein [Oscillospiraceae bacterium OttesenSCG-928-F05]